MDTVIQPDAYDRLASAYGCLTAGYDHNRWIDELVDLARRAGLRGERTLDVACGTGSTALPLIRHGFHVTGVDSSEGMLSVARHRIAGSAEVIQGDMTRLPDIGTFDLVTCLGDALNHLLSRPSVEQSLASMARNVAPGGLLLFDLNTLATLRSAFSTCSVASDESYVVVWRGLGPEDLSPAGHTAAELTVLDLLDRTRAAETIVIEERHHPLEAVLACIRRGGLELVTVRGSYAGGRLDFDAPPDEEVHHKLVVVARRRHTGRGR
jgi:SAM-dependent methyltransferase